MKIRTIKQTVRSTSGQGVSRTVRHQAGGAEFVADGGDRLLRYDVTVATDGSVWLEVDDASTGARLFAGQVYDGPLVTPTVTVRPPDKWCDRWTVLGDLRSRIGPALTDDANHEASRALRDRFPTVDFDSEFSQFYAYADDEADARRVADAVNAWPGTAERHNQRGDTR